MRCNGHEWYRGVAFKKYTLNEAQIYCRNLESMRLVVAPWECLDSKDDRSSHAKTCRSGTRRRVLAGRDGRMAPLTYDRKYFDAPASHV